MRCSIPPECLSYQLYWYTSNWIMFSISTAQTNIHTPLVNSINTCTNTINLLIYYSHSHILHHSDVDSKYSNYSTTTTLAIPYCICVFHRGRWRHQQASLNTPSLSNLSSLTGKHTMKQTSHSPEIDTNKRMCH